MCTKVELPKNGDYVISVDIAEMLNKVFTFDLHSLIGSNHWFYKIENVNGKTTTHTYIGDSTNKESMLYAPTIFVVRDLLEYHKHIKIAVHITDKENYYYIIKTPLIEIKSVGMDFNSYNYALMDAIKVALKMIAEAV